MLYSKCLDPKDYDAFYEHAAIEKMVQENPNMFRYEHPHRKWEYGLAVKLLAEREVKTVLNVGGGNSPLSNVLRDMGMEVTEIDPMPTATMFEGISYILGSFPTEGLGKYDAVISTSVIEHVPQDMDFFHALLDHSNNTVFITTDFSVQGTQFSGAHLRTYSDTNMAQFIAEAKEKGFDTVGEYDYTFKGSFVYQYTFASLALGK